MSKVKSPKKQITKNPKKSGNGLAINDGSLNMIVNDKSIDESKELLDQSARLLDDNIKLLKKVTLTDNPIILKNESTLRKYGLTRRDSSKSNFCDIDRDFTDPDSISISSSELRNADKEISDLFDKELSLMNVDLTPKLKDVSKFKYFKNQILPKGKTEKPLEYIIPTKPTHLVNGYLKNNIFTTDVIDPNKKMEPITVINRSKVNSKLLENPRENRFIKGGHDSNDKKNDNYENLKSEKKLQNFQSETTEIIKNSKKTKRSGAEVYLKTASTGLEREQSKPFHTSNDLHTRKEKVLSKQKDDSIEQNNISSNQNQNTVLSEPDTGNSIEKTQMEENTIKNNENSNNSAKVEEVVQKRKIQNAPFLTYKEMLKQNKRDVLKKKSGIKDVKKKVSQSIKDDAEEDMEKLLKQNENNISLKMTEEVDKVRKIDFPSVENNVGDEIHGLLKHSKRGTIGKKSKVVSIEKKKDSQAIENNAEDDSEGLIEQNENDMLKKKPDAVNKMKRTDSQPMQNNADVEIEFEELLKKNKKDIIKKKSDVVNNMKKKDVQQIKNNAENDMEILFQQNKSNMLKKKADAINAQKKDFQSTKNNVDEIAKSPISRRVEISTDDSLKISKKNSYFKKKAKASEEENSLHTYKKLQMNLAKDIFKENKQAYDPLNDRVEKLTNNRKQINIDNDSQISPTIEDTTKTSNIRALLDKKKGPLYHLYNRSNSTYKGLEFNNNFNEYPMILKSKKTYLPQDSNDNQALVGENISNEKHKKNTLLKTKLNNDDENRTDKKTYLNENQKASNAKTLLLPQDKITTKENFSQQILSPRITAGQEYLSPQPLTLKDNSPILSRKQHKPHHDEGSSQADTLINTNICPTSPRQCSVETTQPYTALTGFKLTTESEELGTGNSTVNTGRSKFSLRNSKIKSKSKIKSNKSKTSPTIKTKVTKTRTHLKPTPKTSQLSKTTTANGSDRLCAPKDQTEKMQEINLISNRLKKFRYNEQNERADQLSSRSSETDFDSSSSEKEKFTGADGEETADNLARNKSYSTGTDESVQVLMKRIRKKKLKTKTKSNELKNQNDSTDSDSPLKKIADGKQYKTLTAPLKKKFPRNPDPVTQMQQNEKRLEGGHDFISTDSSDSLPPTSKTYTTQKLGATFTPIKENVRRNNKFQSQTKKTELKTTKTGTIKKPNKSLPKTTSVFQKLLSKPPSKEQTFFLAKAHSGKLSSAGVTPRSSKFQSSPSQSFKAHNKGLTSNNDHDNMSALKYVRDCEAKLATAHLIPGRTPELKSTADVNAMQYFRQLQDQKKEGFIKLDASKNQKKPQSKIKFPTIDKDKKLFHSNASSATKADKLRNLYSMNTHQLKSSAATSNLTNATKPIENMNGIQETENITTAPTFRNNPYNLDDIFPSVGSTAYRTKAISIVGDNFMNKIMPDVKNTYSEKMRQHDPAKITAPTPSLAAVPSNTAIGKARSNQYKNVISPIASYIKSTTSANSSSKVPLNKPQSKSVDKIIGKKKVSTGTIKSKPTTSSSSRFQAKK
ncbi:putative leucine-rich repeat-containing protein DDB_G0290503 [Teleopsis dalmanni]|uniref:putative leucine-rich repeat-containing protein DDB_G0290503 n=1 Tax=Teleopsis dalmanni TaxID=139649 RepID=UPI0018CCF6F0|nr:putative leucine-rich repeat-containing protein DDB_G0290503 [Teleopsis dalmanni]